MEQQFKLSNFEGPLDLLLHLISSAKIEIKDIFISEITEQYLRCMEGVDTLDLDTASEFLQMAANLLYIKARSLLPEKRTMDDVDEEGLTPEEQLIKRLNEYKLYKEASTRLKVLEDAAKNIFYKLPEELVEENGGEVFLNATTDALFQAYLKMLKRAKPAPAEKQPLEIERESFSVRTQSRLIMARLAIVPKTSFFQLLQAEYTREELAVTFIAVLELLHTGKIKISQEKYFEDIIIEKRGCM